MKSHRSGTRKRSVENVSVVKLKKGDPLFPVFAFEGKDKPDECWMVLTTVKDGRTKKHTFTHICETEAEAARCMTSGSSHAFGDLGYTEEEQISLRPFLQSLIAGGGRFLMRGDIGDEESSLAFDILDEAGISSWEGLSNEVLAFLGNDRVEALRLEFGDNWQVAAEFEFCWLTLPHSSAAFAAAAYRFHWYISGCELSAGYYWRDMELAASGTEAIADTAIEMREKAGAKGKEKSQLARNKRRLQLLQGIEGLCGRNPDFAALDPKRLASLAVRHLAAIDPKLWREGKGQVQQYLSEISVGDAGPEAKARYQALFPPKPPKRFR